MRDERYRPFDIEELEDKVSLLNEPVREVIELRPERAAPIRIRLWVVV